MSRKPPEGMYWCPGCGEPLQLGASHPMVTRIVRAGQHYGDAFKGAGERVEVEARYVSDPVVQRATMSLDEQAEAQAKRSAAAAAGKPKGTLLQMVLAGLNGAIAETRMKIEQGKATRAQKAAFEAQRASEANRG